MELQDALDQCTSLHEKAIKAEMARDTLQDKLDELKEKAMLVYIYIY